MKLDNPLRHPFRVRRVEKPRAEGRFNLSNGRRLGFAEYGDPWARWCCGATARPVPGANSRCSVDALPRSSACALSWWSGRARVCRLRTGTAPWPSGPPTWQM